VHSSSTQAADESIDRRRIVLVSARFAVALRLLPYLREMGHEPVGWVFPHRRTGAERRTQPKAQGSGRLSGVSVASASEPDEIGSLVRAFAPDLVIYWGCPWKVPLSVIDMPRFGSVNLHPGRLPRHRGPIPLAWAVRDGDTHFAVTWHRMDAEFDTGPILAQAEVPITDDACTIEEIMPTLIESALAELPRVLARAIAGDRGDAQPSAGGSWAGRFGADYAVVDWGQPARSIHNQVRAWRLAEGFASVPGPIAELDGKSTKLLRTSLSDPGCAAPAVECGKGRLWIVESERAQRSAV
jgi:methionyl-tRNA formyltransferase